MRRRLLCFLGLLLLVSCIQGGRAPTALPQRTLLLSGEAEGAGSRSPFAVVFAGPRGDTTEESAISIVFNRPMRPLELAGEESDPPVRLEAKGAPVPKGAWRWLGTSALRFAPDPALPRA